MSDLFSQLKQKSGFSSPQQKFCKKITWILCSGQIPVPTSQCHTDLSKTSYLFMYSTYPTELHLKPVRTLWTATRKEHLQVWYDQSNRVNLHECGCCGHGFAVCLAKTFTCFNCGGRGHNAQICRTRSVGAMTMSSTSTRTIGTQTDESARRKSERKTIRDRERMVEFRKQRKETRTIQFSKTVFYCWHFGNSVWNFKDWSLKI